jgi:hypothetical protein
VAHARVLTRYSFGAFGMRHSPGALRPPPVRMPDDGRRLAARRRALRPAARGPGGPAIFMHLIWIRQPVAGVRGGDCFDRLIRPQRADPTCASRASRQRAKVLAARRPPNASGRSFGMDCVGARDQVLTLVATSFGHALARRRRLVPGDATGREVQVLCPPGNCHIRGCVSGG